MVYLPSETREIMVGSNCLALYTTKKCIPDSRTIGTITAAHRALRLLFVDGCVVVSKRCLLSHAGAMSNYINKIAHAMLPD
jgi:hypothetical protein